MMSIQYKCCPFLQIELHVMSDKGLLTIPQNVIDKCIDQVDILEIVQADVKLKKSGRDYVGLCPFHKERSPSFSVSPEKQFFYCFGCGAGGNALEFMKSFHNRSFISVIQEFADIAREDLTPYLMSSQQDKRAINLLPALQAANDLFTSGLNDTVDNQKAEFALQYLDSRKVSAELIQRFSLGYAGYGPKIVELLSDHLTALLEAGVFGQKDHGPYSMFRNRLMLPIRDIQGKVVAMSGRALDPEDEPKYLNSKESSAFTKTNLLYGFYESLKAFGPNFVDQIYVVEGQFDVIAHHMIEKPAAGALGSSISIQQLRLLRRHTRHVTFVFDGDSAGLKALVSTGILLLESLTDYDVTYDMVILDKGDDPHSLITTVPDVYLAKLEDRQPWLDALLDNLDASPHLATQEGRMAYANEAIELIQQARDPLLRYQTLEKVAEKTGFPVKALEEKLEAMPLPRSGHAKSKVTPTKSMNEAAIRLTRMLWDNPSLSKLITEPVLWIHHGDELVSLLGSWAQQHQAGELDASLTPEDQEKLDRPGDWSKNVAQHRRYRGGAAALGRMLSELPSHYMEQLMRGEPEAVESTAVSLSWHITGICARKVMVELSSKAGQGTMTDEDRTNFANLVTINRNAMNRSKSIDT
jgi:DNA primase